jgi:hypothetical protein
MGMLPGRVVNKLDAALNVIKAKLDVGDYWYWLDANEIEDELDIRSLVFPLRYDILIRKSFFEYYEQRRDMYKTSRAEFLREMRDHPYYEWFRKVLVVRYAPQLLSDTVALEQAFADRVTASVSLYDSISSYGFDNGSPIIPYTGKIILPADSGRETGAKYYMGDGCHRLACLMSMGYTKLPREYVRVKCFKHLVPLDNSRLLAASIHVDSEWL